jgi:hypothetical protein
MPKSSVRLYETFLGRVFRIGAIARIAHCQFHYTGPILKHQLVEGPTFSGLGIPHEALVAVSAHCQPPPSAL